MTRLLTFERLKWASFTHSAIYAVLLTVWLVPGLHGFEAAFGMAHGLGWIAMSLACIAALRLRCIDLRLAVAVAVLGGVGPFIGSLEFVRQTRRARGVGAASAAPTYAQTDAGSGRATAARAARGGLELGDRHGSENDS